MLLTDREELEPGIRRFLDEMRADWRDHPALETLSFPEQRIVAEKVRARWAMGGPVMSSTRETTFDPGAGTLRIRTYMPEGLIEPAPVMVYLHGGGFTLFSIDTHDRLMREYAARGGFAVIGIDYPLAPEAKYPEALNRIEAFMLWLKDHGGELGIDPARVAMGGDSAGANLCLATSLRLRDRSELGIVRALLSNYGGFSARRLSDEAEARFGGPESIMDRVEVAQYWANYLRDPSDADDPHVSLVDADLTGFPPVFLVIPERDIIAEQSIAMDARLRAAGIETRSRIYRGAIHSFLEAMEISALAREAIEDGALFVREQLAR